MNRKLRIAVFVGTFPAVSETFILRQITGLLELGHEVDIFADTRAPAGDPIHPEVAKFRLLERTTFMDMPPESAPWELPVWPPGGQTWLPGSSAPTPNWRRLWVASPTFFRCLLSSPSLTRAVLSRSRFGYQANSLSALYRLAKLSSISSQYDVLHAHFGPVGNSFRFTRQLWRAPLVVSFHGYDFSTQPRKEGRSMYAQLFATADLITVNSLYTRSCVEKLGCPPEKLRLLPVGLNLDDFPFYERKWTLGEPIRLLSIARLTPIKGHEYILRALALLRTRNRVVHFDIAGDGPLRKSLESLASELGLADSVVFHGSCAAEQARALLRKAHLFILGSVSIEGDQEGQGLVLQEAQACGIPVLATAHGALPEGMVNERSGVLFQERDPEALADKLDSLIQRASEWQGMGRAGRQFVQENYDIRELNRKLLDLYHEVIEKTGMSFRAGDKLPS